MSGQPIAGRLRELRDQPGYKSADMCEALTAGARTIDELVEALKLALPKHVSVNNPNISDGHEVPLVAPMGVLRKIVAAIAKAEGRS